MRFLGDEERVARLSLIDEQGERYVRMAHLACVGSHAINGVAALHSDLLKQDVLTDFHAAVAGEVQQQDQRRHAAALDGAEQSAPGPVAVSSAIGDGWIRDLTSSRALEPLARTPGFAPSGAK